MAKTAKETKSDSPPSFLKTLWRIGTGLIGGIGPVLERLREDWEHQLDHYARIIEKRLMVLALRACAVFMSFFFFGTGLLLVLIDYGGVPRGIACLCCGLLSLAVLMVSVQFTK